MLYQQTEEAREYLQEQAAEYGITVRWAQFAHELAHVIHGDVADVVFYQASFTGKESIEYKANVGAIKLLVPFYCQDMDIQCANSANFMQAFHVPHYLSDVVRDKIWE